ncbi:hypothetical protein L593_00730 [Salinarchaeum sp. Harcht-Bsk1]|uniref:hypothetical protein n=1 Tax=Salinarchaeum sp. Harcht-Bsk1 TaxID=1333523 RepID=UPI000342362A|nr:hypothetical protein [Salinarchaeum sp. Harcht-Bsk1]AGN00101.1 hypothetical protein L593_00730 [Salinarchaeum sp. Harcht-Bsk1]
MGSPTARTIERHLLALDHDAFVEFVAALWTGSNWSVERGGPVLEIGRPGEQRRLLVLPPRRTFPGAWSAPAVEDADSIDAVVSPYRTAERSRLPRNLPVADVVTADGIRDRLLYALDESTRDRLLADHLGLDVEGSDATGLRPLPPVRIPDAGRVTAAGVGVFLLLTGIAVLVAATGVFPGGSSTTTVNASGPTSAGAYASADSPVYQSTPTCTRSPREVVEVTTAAVRGPRLGAGLVVMGRFWNPTLVEGVPTGVWDEMMRSDARMEYYNSSSVRFDDAVVLGDDAVVRATAVLYDGTERVYEFSLSRRDSSPHEGCWVIDGFAPVEDLN